MSQTGRTDWPLEPVSNPVPETDSNLEEVQRQLDLLRRELAWTQGQLRQAGKLAGLADEMVQPLTAVLGFAERLRILVEQKAPSRLAEADLMLQSSRRMASILDVARRSASPSQPGTGDNETPPG